ncbi:MAG: hypothetical protein AAF664_10300 [Planctomycetota bacterium]
MGRLTQVAGVSSLLLGFVGCLVCIALLLGAFVLDAKLQRTTETVYSDLDELFLQARNRVNQLDDVVSHAKSTTSEVGDLLDKWSSRVSERRPVQQSVERIQLNAKTSELASILMKADSFAAMSADSLSLAIKIVDIANRSGVEVDGAGLEALHSDIVNLRDEFDRATQNASGLSKRFREEVDLDSLGERLIDASLVIPRVIEVLDGTRASIRQVGKKLSESQSRVADTESQLLGWIEFATVLVNLLVLWSFAGQFALGKAGWRIIRG